MSMHWITSTAAAVTLTAGMAAAPAQAAMSPAINNASPIVQRADCAVGFHIGPAGGCIAGVEEEHHDTVIEHRGTDEGCQTKSVHKSDDMGNSETKTKTNCD